MDSKGNQKQGSKYSVDKGPNYLQVDGKLRPGAISNPLEKFFKPKFVLNNGVYPFTHQEAAHYNDIMRESSELNVQTALNRRLMKLEDMVEKKEFRTVFDMDDKDFIIRDDKAYKKNTVVPRKAKVARGISEDVLREDYSEIVSGIKQPDHLARYKKVDDNDRFYRTNKRSSFTAFPSKTARNQSFSTINSNPGTKAKQKDKKELKSHRNANSMPALPQINI